MKAKVYERKGRKGTRFFVYLYWKGERKKLYRDVDGQPFKAKYRADRMADRINGDIEDKGNLFDLNKWFGVAANTLSFSTYVDTWLERRKAAGEVTEEYLRDVGIIARKYWLPFFKDLDIREIRRGHLDDFLASLPEHLGPRARQYYTRTLRKMFSDAYEREEIDKIPPFPRVKVPEKEIEWLTLEERAQVMAEIKPYNRPIYEFFWFHGCRPIEAARLEWPDIAYEREQIIFKKTKNGQVKRLPLMPEMVELLKPIRGIAGPVFRGSRSGRAYSVNWLSKIWRDANKKANEKHGTPIVPMYCGNKHTRGMQLGEDPEWDVLSIQRLFGHKKLESTLRYVRATDKTLRAKLSGVQTGNTKSGAKPQ